MKIGVRFLLCLSILVATILPAAQTNTVYTEPTYYQSKASDQTITNSTTLAACTGLGFPLKASRKYRFQMIIPFNLNSVTSGYKFKVTVPASPASFWAGSWVYDGATTTGLVESVMSITAPGQLAKTLAIAGDHVLLVKGFVETGETEGDLGLDFAGNVNVGAVKIYKGAILEVSGPVR